MGILYKATCSKCHYEHNFSLGSGLIGLDISRSILMMSSEEKTQILRMQERQEIAEFIMENRLVKCKNCTLGLTEKAIIIIRDLEDQYHVFGSYCSQCGNLLEIYESNIASKSDIVVCPECCKGFIKFLKVGIWD